MIRIGKSSKNLHVISGLDLGTIEKNIINKDLGVSHVFGDAVSYRPGGAGPDRMPHILYRTPSQTKVIYILGYDDKRRWKKALGGQYGCVYIDEINVADMDYVREISMRCDYLMATLNPDDPGLPVYEEYINHARPLPRWAHETPPELMAQLDRPPKDGWTHWYFSFVHNAGLTDEKRTQIESNVPKGTKLYKNKIQGLRGRSTGLIFNIEPAHIINYDAAKKYTYKLFACGVDTSYSQQSNDTIAFVFTGITECRKKITLACRVFNNKTLNVPLSPSDIPPMLIEFLDKNRDDWGFSRDVFIDSADQATITELSKYKRNHGGLYSFVPAWKDLKILDRINLELGWLAKGQSLILDTCKENISEMNLYSWKEDKNEPEDRNDHTINAGQYSWIPFKRLIGQGGIADGVVQKYG
jgi:hypothetical protein